MTAKRIDELRGSRRAQGVLARYAREIVVVLVVKLIAIFAIWHLWFSGAARHDVGPQRIADHVYSSPPPTAPREERHARP